MRRPAPVPRRRNLGIILMAVALVVLGTMGAFITLAALGKIPLAFLKRKPTTEGLYGYPISVRSIPANTRVTRDDLLDPRTKSVRVFYVPREEADPTILVDLDKILGRVVKVEKAAGYAFTDADFFEEGTRSGLVAAVPPGKRAFALNISKLQGTVFGLSAGDHCDLLATIVLDSPKSPGLTTPAGIHTSESALQADAASHQKKAVVRVLVHDGIVITPAAPPQVSKAGRTQLQTRPQQEIVLAIDPTEVAPLTEALATNVEIACAARSGRPNEIQEVSVPISAQTIPAYTRVTRDYLLDPLTGSTKMVYIKPDRADSFLVTDPYKIVGRILAHDKPAGFFFTEEDFLPEGSTPGLPGAIPPGKRAMALNRSKMQGLDFGLKPGDRVDVVATVPVDYEKVLSHLHLVSTGPDLIALQALADPQNKTAIKVLAQNSTVVAPLIAHRTYYGGGASAPATEEDIILAVDPIEVAPLTQAMAANLTLVAVARSSVAGDEGGSIATPGSDSNLRLSAVEMIQGNKREMVVFPRRSEATTAQAPEK